jgi:CheY-like chemotaxis protein
MTDPRGSAGRGATVVYVEDNPANVRLVELILDEVADVLAAGTGQHGIAIVRELLPSLVLLDLGLPDMPGERVLKSLRADPTTAQVPIVILSGDLPEPRRQQLLELGATALLAKPYGMQDLIALVSRLIASPDKK